MYNVTKEKVEAFMLNIHCAECNEILTCCGAMSYDSYPPSYTYYYKCINEKCSCYNKEITSNEKFPRITYKPIKEVK